MPSPRPASPRRLALTALALTLLLAACVPGGSGGLAPGLTARMDQPGASLDRVQALSLINQYRHSRGANALAGDASLDAIAQGLAGQYAATNNRPARPDSVQGLRISAGYASFAETFSGWRNSPEDAGFLTTSGVARAGLGVVYSPASTYGVHWVLVLAE